MTLGEFIIRVTLRRGLVLLVDGVEEALHVNEGDHDCLFRAAEHGLAGAKILADAHPRGLGPVKVCGQHYNRNCYSQS